MKCIRQYTPAPPTPKIVVIAAALVRAVETPAAIAEVPTEMVIMRETFF